MVKHVETVDEIEEAINQKNDRWTVICYSNDGCGACKRFNKEYEKSDVRYPQCDYFFVLGRKFVHYIKNKDIRYMPAIQIYKNGELWTQFLSSTHDKYEKNLQKCLDGSMIKGTVETSADLKKKIERIKMKRKRTVGGSMVPKTKEEKEIFMHSKSVGNIPIPKPILSNTEELPHTIIKIEYLQNIQEFRNVTENSDNNLVLINFTKDKCNASTRYKEFYQRAARKHEKCKFYYMLGNNFLSLLKEQNITHIPMVQIWKNGTAVATFLGLKERELKEKIKLHIA